MNPPNDILTQPGQINKFMQALTTAGVPSDLLEHLTFVPDRENFTAAVTYAFLSRLELSHSQIPNYEWSQPLLINWSLPAIADKNQIVPSYITVDRNNIMHSWLVQLQPDAPAANATVFQSTFVRPINFSRTLKEVTQFRIRDSIFVLPGESDTDHCFSLLHALQIIHEIFIGLLDLKLIRVGFIPGPAISDPLYIPIRFAKFDKPHGSVGVTSSGLLVIRPLTKERISREHQTPALHMQFIPEAETESTLLPVGSIVCVNNIEWFRKEP